jgi:predicted DNA-binding transcriptional regulator AlpA
MNKPVDDWMTTQEVALACGVSTQTILRWHHAGDGFPPAHRFGRRVLRWKRPVILSFIESVQDPNNTSPFVKPKE